jgi:hypothetical protein
MEVQNGTKQLATNYQGNMLCLPIFRLAIFDGMVPENATEATMAASIHLVLVLINKNKDIF